MGSMDFLSSNYLKLDTLCLEPKSTSRQIGIILLPLLLSQQNNSEKCLISMIAFFFCLLYSYI